MFFVFFYVKKMMGMSEFTWVKEKDSMRADKISRGYGQVHVSANWNAFSLKQIMSIDSYHHLLSNVTSCKSKNLFLFQRLI